MGGSMSKTVVLVGANRGIGLELAKQYKQLGHNVYAVCRSASEELKALDVNCIEGVDVLKDDVGETLKTKLSLNSIDLFIHNAGILKGDSFPDISSDNMRLHFEVNTLGPMKTILALRDSFKQKAKVGIVTSRVGSIEDNSSSNNYAYRVSKTAANMLGKCLSIDLKEQGVAVALLHPGYVKTDMTGNTGYIEADEAASGLIKRMDELTLETTGSFMHSNGENLPW